jgi:hypothetical protein
LTATGALGGAGAEVGLDAELSRYALPLEPVDPRGAMTLSLNLIRSDDVAPAVVTVPLWAAMYRAPTAHALPVDMSIWLEGTTGSLKSTLAALMLAHFGPFDRLTLLASWTSTSNALERKAFLAKGLPLIVDDSGRRRGEARRAVGRAGQRRPIGSRDVGIHPLARPADAHPRAHAGRGVQDDARPGVDRGGAPARAGGDLASVLGRGSGLAIRRHGRRVRRD